MSVYACLQELQAQLTSEAEGRDITNKFLFTILAMIDQIEAGRAVLPYLEMLVIHRACSDPGALITNELLLPILQERVTASAQETARKKEQELQEQRLKEQVRDRSCLYPSRKTQTTSAFSLRTRASRGAEYFVIHCHVMRCISLKLHEVLLQAQLLKFQESGLVQRSWTREGFVTDEG